MTDAVPDLRRRTSMLALLGLVAGCGGGGGGGAAPPATALAGSVQSASITARSNATIYPLSVYLPPASAGARGTLPAVYLLDGESRFQTMVDIVEAGRAPVMIVGIGNEALRARDYVPANLCTGNGGGEAAFLDFIRFELIPYIEASVGGDPARRILLGHSHGGSFVLYALFAETDANRHFSAYLASDASIDCMRSTVYAWETIYAISNPSLAVRLHVSYGANLANSDFVLTLQARHYAGLALAGQSYSGGHIGMIPAAFADALAFALA